MINAGAGLAVAFIFLTWLAANTAHAQPSRSVRVGVLASSSEANFEPSVKVFREALQAAG